MIFASAAKGITRLDFSNIFCCDCLQNMKYELIMGVDALQTFSWPTLVVNLFGGVFLIIHFFFHNLIFTKPYLLIVSNSITKICISQGNIKRYIKTIETSQFCRFLRFWRPRFCEVIVKNMPIFKFFVIKCSDSQFFEQTRMGYYCADLNYPHITHETWNLKHFFFRNGLIQIKIVEEKTGLVLSRKNVVQFVLRNSGPNVTPKKNSFGFLVNQKLHKTTQVISDIIISKWASSVAH